MFAMSPGRAWRIILFSIAICLSICIVMLFRNCLNLIDYFCYGHKRADFYLFSREQWGSIVTEKRGERCRLGSLRKTLN